MWSAFSQRHITPEYSVLELSCGTEQQCGTISSVLQHCIKKLEFLEVCTGLSCKLQEQCFNVNLLEHEGVYASLGFQCLPKAQEPDSQVYSHLFCEQCGYCVIFLHKCEPEHTSWTAS